MPGGIAGIGLSVVLLRYLIPELLGRQYLNGYGGAEELRIFRVEILLLAVAFTLLVILGASEQVIRQTVNRNLYRRNTLHEADGKKETTAWKSRSWKSKSWTSCFKPSRHSGEVFGSRLCVERSSLKQEKKK